MGGVRCVSDEPMRHRQRRKDADTQDCMDEGTRHRFWDLERRCRTRLPNQQEEGSWTHDSILEYSMLNSSSESVVVTNQRSAIKKTRAANVRRILQSERWDADRTLGMRAFPWSPDGSDNTTRGARTYFRRADFDHWGLSEGCPGCWYL